MKQFIILLLLATIVFACGGGDEPAGRTPARTPAKAPTGQTADATPQEKTINTKKIWKVRCIACHGVNGDMGTNGAANLQEVTSDLEYRINIITNGSENGVMTPFGEVLSEEEIVAMAKYTMKFNKDL